MTKKESMRIKQLEKCCDGYINALAEIACKLAEEKTKVKLLEERHDNEFWQYTADVSRINITIK